MSTLAGWFENAVGCASPDITIDTMTHAYAHAGSEWRDKRTSISNALAVNGRKDGCALASSESLWAAIVGQPRWDDAELAAIAMEHGQASSLISAYRRHGDDLFRVLRGAFSLAVVDEAAARVMLAIDRFGIGSMYYSEPKSGGLVFGRNADCVRAHPSVDRSISDQAIFNYLYFSICPSPGTIYREQFKLLPAQYLVYEKGVSRKAFYWQMPYREKSDKDVRSLCEEVMRLLRVAVRRSISRTEASTIGAFLSGGLDSSTVVGLLSEATGGSTRAFTIGFSHDRYDETHYAEIVARYFAVQHHKHYLVPTDVAHVLGKLSRVADEPFGNSSVVPAYYCAKMARENDVALMLAGDGGDEIFAGNSRYVDQQIFDLYAKVPEFVRAHMLEPVLFRTPGLARMSLGRKAQNYVRRALLPMPDRAEARNFYETVDLDQVFETDVLQTIDRGEPLANLRDAYERTHSRSMLQRMMHLDLKITLADNDLRKIAIASDMAGVTSAYPFLDDEVVEFAAQVPSPLLIRRLSRRWFFRKAVKDFLPPETLAKRKHGFGMPYTEWPRDDPELREITLDCVTSFKRRHYFKSDFLDRVVLGEEDASIYHSLVWDIVMLELWLREREARV